MVNTTDITSIIACSYSLAISSHVYPYLFLSITLVFGEAKLCKFDGHHYCYECHLDDERVVPARVLFNWDFRKHRVCIRSCEFLDSIEFSPVLNVEEINRALYHYIPELEQAKVRFIWP